MKKKSLILLCLLLAVAMMASACGGNNSNSANTGNTGTSATESGSSNASSPSNTGTDSGSKSGEKVTLDFMTNSADMVLAAYENVAKRYMEQNPNVTITVTSQGKDYESLMKMKMAANDLPDMWMTHGWSVARYSEYLEPLTNQPWADKIADTIRPIISNDNGDIFVLPLDIDKSGVVMNLDVLNEAGVNYKELKTWDDFINAFEKVKAIGKIPVGMGGKDPRDMAQFFDVMATQMFIASPSNDYSQQLLDGTFDWSLWDKMSELLLSLQKNGYLNKDVLTCDPDTLNQMVAKNEVAFLFKTNSVITSIRDYNPDANMGFMPLPTIHPDGRNVFIGGERNAVGVWKDSKNKEEALKFLEFLAQPENMSEIAKAQGNTAAFKDVQVDLGVLTPYFEEFKDVEVQPYFDRVYLPSGMWSTLQSVGSGLLSGDLTVDAASKLMQNDYTRLKSGK